MGEIKITDKEIDDYYKKLKEFNEKHGYYFNPDIKHTKLLLRGILMNVKRYGYGACPCRLASGKRNEDLDIICPCNYRDLDINEFGHCYCSLYSSFKNLTKKEFKSIPERRKAQIEEPGKKTTKNIMKNKKIQTWRCQVCGYLCAREDAPDKCPICGADHDRFERFD